MQNEQVDRRLSLYATQTEEPDLPRLSTRFLVTLLRGNVFRQDDNPSNRDAARNIEAHRASEKFPICALYRSGDYKPFDTRVGSSTCGVRDCREAGGKAVEKMAVFRVVTFLIHAIVQAIASLLVAVFTHFVPAMVAIAALVALTLAVCASCGIGGITFFRHRKEEAEDTHATH